jgi:hypothetical protein
MWSWMTEENKEGVDYLSGWRPILTEMGEIRG